MTIDRSERITFDEVAELYDEVRPRYPQELVEDIVTFSRIPPCGRILEVGCGPGNATVPFAQRGFRMVCLELGARLAALAARNCRPYPGVVVHNVAFEDWELQEGAFDLVLSAEAFHWIPPEIAYPRAAAALKDIGSIALFWNVDIDPGTALSRAIGEVYRERAPQVDNPFTAMSPQWLIERIQDNLAASGCFGEALVRQYSCSRTYSGAQYLKLLRTISSHRRLDEDTRQKLFAGLLEVIERLGGNVSRSYQVVLFLSRVKGRAQRR